MAHPANHLWGPFVKHQALNNQQGQMAVESILIMAVLVIIFTQVVQPLVSDQIGQIVSRPWVHIQGMVETGIWEPIGEARIKHPNNYHRHVSTNPGG